MPCVFNNHSISNEPDERRVYPHREQPTPPPKPPLDPLPALQPIGTHDRGGMLSPG
jgi:hypothetical protein